MPLDFTPDHSSHDARKILGESSAVGVRNLTSYGDSRELEQIAQREAVEGSTGERSEEGSSLWHEIRETDFWHEPKTARQYARQRILAVVLTFILAALLAEIGH